jgi:small subunit ribosomal protein S20
MMNFGGFTLANHKSAAKRARQTVRRTQKNSQTKKAVRSEEKKVRLAIDNSDKVSAEKLLLVYTSKMAKAAQKGIYHSATASRKIGRLSKQVFNLPK